MRYDTLIQVGESPLFLTQQILEEIASCGGSPVIIRINPDDIPGLYDADSDDGHTRIWEKTMARFGFTPYEVCLWEEGATESPFYRSPASELLGYLVDRYSIVPESVYAIQYDAHIGCDCLDDEFRDGHTSDCRGSALDVLFPMGARNYNSALVRA